MLKVDYSRWNQTPDDLRRLSTDANHQRTRERFMALYDIVLGSFPAEVARRTGRHHQTILSWVHHYNERGPEALTFSRTGGRPPFAKKFSRRSRKQSSRP